MIDPELATSLSQVLAQNYIKSVAETTLKSALIGTAAYVAGNIVSKVLKDKKDDKTK
jgi:hypothetical protein